MNTRNLLVSVLMLVCVLLSACGPVATATLIVPTAMPATAVPATEAPNEFALAGDPIPDKLLNVDFNLVEGNPPNVMQFYSPDDSICRKLNTKGNCFTILRPDHDPVQDPGARGPAALVNGLVAVKVQLCLFCDLSEIGAIEYFELQENGGVLVGVMCETKSGTECNADVGSTWKSAAQKTTFHSPEDASFRLPLTFSYGPGWDVYVGANALNIVYGNEWGAGISLLNDALVHDPATAVSDQPASANKADFVNWPDDFFAYLTSLPDAKPMTEPTPITLGGIQGMQIIIKTPQMHPILWLKDDYTWLGGGSTGVDPELKRLMILLEVNGESILLEFDDSSEKFDERYPLVQEIFNSITFTK
jgi:hypothetical protein